MQLGPVRFTMDARNQAAHRPFNHNLIIRETGLCIDDDDLRIQEIYQWLTTDKLGQPGAYTDNFSGLLQYIGYC